MISTRWPSSFAEDATFDGRGVPDHYEGRAAIRSMLEEWFGSYEELEFGLEEVRDLGNGVVFAVVVQNGRPAGSAGHLRQREGWVFVWVRGLIARLTYLRGRRGPCCRRTPRAGTGVGGVGSVGILPSSEAWSLERVCSRSRVAAELALATGMTEQADCVQRSCIALGLAGAR